MESKRLHLKFKTEVSNILFKINNIAYKTSRTITIVEFFSIINILVILILATTVFLITIFPTFFCINSFFKNYKLFS